MKKNSSVCIAPEICQISEPKESRWKVPLGSSDGRSRGTAFHAYSKLLQLGHQRTLQQDWMSWVNMVSKKYDHQLCTNLHFWCCVRQCQASHQVHLKNNCPISILGSCTPGPLSHHIPENAAILPGLTHPRQCGKRHIKIQDSEPQHTCNRAGLG